MKDKPVAASQNTWVVVGGLIAAAIAFMLLWAPLQGAGSGTPPVSGSADEASPWRFTTPLTFTDSLIDRLDREGFDGDQIIRHLIVLGIEPSHLALVPTDSVIDGDARQCLAEAIYHEARGQSVMGRLAVSDVILHRVEDPRFPSTVCGVVYQGHKRGWGCQFSFICAGVVGQEKEQGAWDDALALSQLILEGFTPPVTGFATYYHADYIRPRWASAFVQTKTIDDHVFYRPPGALKLLEQRLEAMATD